MKKIGVLLCASAMAVSLTACGGKDESRKTENVDSNAMWEQNTQTQGEEEQKVSDSSVEASTDSVMDLYYKVLTNKTPFVSVDEAGKEVYLNGFQYVSGGSSNDVTITPTQFAVADMDGDGNKEVVLELDMGFDGAYEVLHTIGDKVYGYNYVYRAMSKLYDNGYALGADGANTWNIYQLSFTEAAAQSKNIAGCNAGAYFINETQSATEQEYEDYQESLTPAQWYSFTESNLQAQLGTTGNSTADSGEASIDEGGNTYNSDETSMITVAKKTSGYMLDSEYETLADEQVKYIPKDILRYARNEIYARHGYIFETSDMKTFFENKEWYTPTISKSAWNDNTNLSVIERSNVALITKYENDTMTQEALSLTEKNGVTVASDGDFSIELPSEWNSGNFFVMKSQDAEGVSYQFISRNNFMYGSGGMVFNLVKNIGEYEGTDFMDNVIDLGEAGGYHYYMGQATDVQKNSQVSGLLNEWNKLNKGYQQIADSFSAQ